MKDTPLREAAVTTIRIEANVFPFCPLLDLNKLNSVTSFRANGKQVAHGTLGKVPKLTPLALDEGLRRGLPDKCDQ